jgi:GMC oxidoreductase
MNASTTSPKYITRYSRKFATEPKNLFIVDGSLFVTSGGVNPTSTIQALALFIADQMKQRLANLFD